VSCTKAQEVLGAAKLEQAEVIDARKQKIEEEDAWQRIRSCERVVIAKGKQMVEKTTDEKNKAEILKMAMGRSGSLRAPTLLVGDTLLIGFNDAMYDHYLRSGA
jgi:arsenate reductase-like glutaredoxin family protein